MRRERFALPKQETGAGVRVICPRCGHEYRLLMHKDAKTAPGVWIEQDKRGRITASATVPNAFPLPAGPLEGGGSCPGATEACRNCYAARIESWAPGFRRGASANLDTLRHLYGCGGSRAVVGALVAMVEQSADLQRSAGVSAPVFRWHSDGDLFAEWYARAVRRAIAQTPGVDHWLYTRSLSLVRHLLPVADNARVYLSADRFNVDAVAKCAKRYGLPVAMLADNEDEGRALWARVLAVAPIPSPVLCPAVGKWARDGLNIPAHVVGPDGRRSSAVVNGPGVGACVACGVCLPGGTRSVTFTVHGGTARGDSAGAVSTAVRLRAVDRAKEGAAS